MNLLPRTPRLRGYLNHFRAQDVIICLLDPNVHAIVDDAHCMHPIHQACDTYVATWLLLLIKQSARFSTSVHTCCDVLCAYNDAIIFY